VKNVQLVREERRSYSPRTLIFIGAVAAGALAYVYRDVVVELVRVWSTNDYYSHGFLIPPIAAFLAWERRERFRQAPIRPSLAGLVFIIVSILALAPGVPVFLARFSIVSAIAAVVLMFFGWSRLRTVAFPLAILLLMIPLPAPVFESIELPLRNATSVLSEVFIRAAGIPVVREGNLLTLSNIVLEVARECSGIRSTIALVTIGLVFGYVPESRSWSRLLVAALTVPVVILTNSIRVAATAVSTHYYGPAAATGFVHDLYGWIAFAAAFAIMFLLHRFLFRSAPAPQAP
jgi:exosortase